MGTSPDLGVSEARCTMRAFVFVLLAAVAVNAEAEADAYTIGQVAHGLTNGGVVTGVDYSNGVVSGYGAIGNRPISHVAGVYNAHPINTVAGVYNTHAVHNVAGVYNAHHVTPAVYSNVYSNVYSGLNHLYGKREAEAEADPLLYTNSLVHHTGVGHVAGVYNTHAVPVVHTGVKHVAGVYNTHPFHHVFGKREAEAEPEAEAEADPLLYSGVGHVAGVHPSVYNTHIVPTVHTGVKHVAGVYKLPPVTTVTGVTHTVPTVHAGVYTVNTPSVHSVGVPAVYSNVYTGFNHLYGKREADAEPAAEAEPYTIGQIHAGLPVANAFVTGHPHNVGYITNMVSP